jgi:ATP-binding cassette subfamily B protein
LSFHLSRETGKVLRIVSKGAQGFAHILRFIFFNLGPIFLEVTFLVIVLGVLYPWKYAVITLGFIIGFVIISVWLTERRASDFKDQSKKDAGYTQKATDSLLNFETVKYFNANDHE